MTSSNTLPWGSKRGKIVCVEGNIATGKTTLIKTLYQHIIKSHPDMLMTVIEEKVDQDILQKFNQNPSAYGAIFQSDMMKRRIESMRLAEDFRKNGFLVIMDTGMVRELSFSMANLANHNMTKQEYDSHMHELEVLYSTIGRPLPDYLIFLDCSPARCMENIQKRNRLNETDLSLQYLSELKRCHAETIDTLQSQNPGIQLIQVDVTSIYAEPIKIWGCIQPGIVV